MNPTLHAILWTFIAVNMLGFTIAAAHLADHRTRVAYLNHEIRKLAARLATWDSPL